MNIKEKIYSHLLTTINDKILSLENILIELKESISNETKSTAGDKYETARAMLHLEQENIFKQLRNANDQRKELELIDISKNSPFVSNGSLITTDKDSFFISIGFGKVEINSKTIIVLSSKSPLGKIFMEKRVGDACFYLSQTYFITAIA
ncbi:MAG: hypothetical protein IPI31_03565 [Bacteroidetes bacterium]|nr:hypothetical protein [Bacteroidota bacterium]